MASRADRHKPQGYVPPKRRARSAGSLPPNLPHYELQRLLEPNPGTEGIWKYDIQYASDGLPLLAESSPPPFRPVDLTELFGRQAPLEIEIGMGKGSFLIPYARLHPELDLLGIEWAWPIALHAHERLQRQVDLDNARILVGDAPFFLRDRLPRRSVQAFHIYFPDPWPKERARKRRLMQPEFLSILRLCARPGARLHWGTDHEEYDRSTREVLQADGGFALLIDDAPPTDGLRTNFESKYLLEGRPIHRSVWEISPAA
jgi:tRNA (guanine-N7-)-methyltransferase